MQEYILELEQLYSVIGVRVDWAAVPADSNHHKSRSQI